ncbi:acyl-CoA dehydrogenase family protein [Rhodococcus coprophilus]|uniref:Acyl-CoA dehydrogenase n=1 Tax=Rhodococcus coprophilus TaxID=38310 RepID=A0A2X4U948_9NOCA|nr:acyl-CoA dehydrogenase family protein [Rhodococcus coprophilus]MBM7459513.1 alkylation response protein AidB-like acyl-CoA dehydrogenase [Rhodococcus coprophilus]SQI36346.1 acyl-CoA dehydrogenase [Rhodococcus coprophilus]
MTTTATAHLGDIESQFGGLRTEVREFLAGELASGGFVPDTDSWMTGFDAGFSTRVAERGWLGMTIPTEYGGHGRSPLERFVVNEEMLAHGAPVAAHWIADRQMAPGILANGSDEQKERYLPGIASGSSFFAIGMSEPDAGSDLAAVRARAVDHGDSWTINGTKVWTTGAHIAHAMVVLARTDGQPTDRQIGLSQFVVDLPHPDIEIRPLHSIDGQSHFNEVVFHDARVPASALLGIRGNGWSQVMSELAFERSGPERYLSTMPLLRAWATRLAETGATAGQRHTLGSLTARAWALRRMSLQVAAELSAGCKPDVLAAMVKDLGSTFEGDLVEAVRASSHIVVRRDGVDPLARMLAQSILHTPVFTLRGGTNEILRGIVARGLGVR